jgi:CheY-like chemotaxis protein
MEKKKPVPFAPSILIAEDDPTTRRMFSRTLEEVGYYVAEAATGREAWESILDRHFDLLIMDVSMPVLDGIELIQLAKAEAPHLRVLAVSGFVGGAFLYTVQKLGASSTLRKPVSEDVLLAEVFKLMGTALI